MNALQVVFFVIKHDDSVKKPWCCDKKKATTVLQIKSDNMFVTVEDLHSSYLPTQQLLQFTILKSQSSSLEENGFFPLK